jgi:WD40 repeat protein
MESFPNQQLEETIKPNRLKNQNMSKDTFLCSICKNLLSLVESKICSNCGEQFCKNCKDYNCPVEECDPSYHNGALSRPVREQLENLEVKCKFNGCPNYIYLKDLNDHQSICNFRRQKCDFCNSIFDYESIEEHKENCTQRVVKCDDCSFQEKRNQFQHDCKIFQRFDLIDRKFERFDFYDKKFELFDLFDKKIEELEKRILKLSKLLKIPSRNTNENKKRLKKRNFNNFNKESINNENNIEGHSNYDNYEIDLKFVKYKRFSLLKSKPLTAVSEMKIDNSFLVGNYQGEIRFCNYYKFSSTYSPMHEGPVSYILDLETSDKKFITAGEDNKLIIRKLSDENYFEIIEQGIHSIYLERTNQADKIISIDSDHKIRVWDIRNKRLLRTIEGKSPISIDRFRKNEVNNYYLLSQGNKVIELYDLDRSATVNSFKNEFGIRFILYYQGDYFLTYDEKNTICLWNVGSREPLAKYQFNGKGAINSMFIVKPEVLAFITSIRDIYFLNLSENKLLEIDRKNLLFRKGNCKDDEIYFGKYNKILAVFKNYSNNLYLFKFTDV